VSYDTFVFAGRLKHYVNEWEKLTADPNILDIVKHCHIELIFKCSVYQNTSFSQYHFSSLESVAIENEIKQLLKIGVIVEARPHKNQFISPIFLRPKKNGEYRIILNS